MKKITLFLIIITFLFVINVQALSSELSNVKKYEDLNTKNFVQKFSETELKSIKMICTYDYCDYYQNDSPKKGIEIFVNKYVKTISDEEIKSSLKVKA